MIYNIVLVSGVQKTDSVMYKWAFQVVLVVKNLNANAGNIRDTGLIPGLGRSPAKRTATHSSILAWRISRPEEPGGLWSVGWQNQI